MSRIINTTVAVILGVTAIAAIQTQMPGFGPKPKLPPPSDGSKTVHLPIVTGWPDGKTPNAPQGFTVTRYAGDFVYPRWIYVLPNGDVLVSEARTALKKNQGADEQRLRIAARSDGDSPNRITLLRDADGDGTPEVREVFLAKLNQPFGMLLRGDTFYVANTDGIVAYPYKSGETKITAAGKKILDLPADGYNNHWTRNIVSNADGTKFYVTVGSGTNVDVEKADEKDPRRAAILEVNRARLHYQREGRRVLWLAVLLLRSERGSAEEG
jgi:glucose/arabinose dehydrogenase